MRHSLFKLWLALTIGALALFSALPSSAAPLSNPQDRSHSITLFLPDEPATLDWNISDRRIDQLLILNLQEGLFEAGTDRKPHPVLAKSWSVSPDGKTYTFSLKSGIKWSDGKPLVAQNFVDSWKRLLSPITATGNGYFLLDVEGAEDFFKGRNTDFAQVGIKALNDSTIQIKLRKPLWNFVWNFAEPATFPIRQDLIDLHGAKFWTAPGNLVTVGPFVLVSHDLHSSYVLQRNPRYYGKTGNIIEVDYKILSDPDAIREFSKGDLDLACEISGVESVPAATRHSLAWLVANTTKRLDFNVKRFPLTLPSVRQAIALAINRRELAKELGLGISAAGSAAPPSMLSHFENSGDSFDPARARKLLRAAGVDHLSLDILIPLFDEHAEDDLRAATLIRKMLQENLFAEVTLQKAETERLYSLLRDTHQFSLLLRDWTGTNDPDEYYAFYASQTKKSTNWSDASYDALLEKSRTEREPKDRLATYRSMEQLLVSKQYAVFPLFYESDATLVGPRISGFDRKSLQPCMVRDLSVINPPAR